MDSTSRSDSNDPYESLGIEPGSSFEQIQAARDKRLLEVGDDSIARAKIESSYDSLLMSSLKERQQGNVSNEAVNS